MTQHDALVANPERLLDKGLLDLGDLEDDRPARTPDADQARRGFQHHPVFDPSLAKVPPEDAPEALSQDPDAPGDPHDMPGKAPDVADDPDEHR